MSIERIVGGTLWPGSVPEAAPAPASGGADFASSLGRMIDGVERTGAEANSAVGRMLDGSGDVHEAMIALQRADLALSLTVQVRNKLVSAYQEIMRMSV